MSRPFQELTNRPSLENSNVDPLPSKKSPQLQSDVSKGDQACCPTPGVSAGVSADVAWRSLNCGICSGWLASSLVLSCGHSFCGQCLFDWINDKPSCPACQVGLRAVPVRSLALDAAVTAFEHLLPEGERINLKQRTDDGHSAANKLNKMLWWLQPAAVPALGAQGLGAPPGAGGANHGGQYNHTNLPQQQQHTHNSNGAQYNSQQQQQRGQPPRQQAQPHTRRSSMGGCGPQMMAGQQAAGQQQQLGVLNRSHSVTAAMPPMQRAVSSGGADSHLFACHGNVAKPPAAARPKSFSGMDSNLGDQLAAARASWHRESLIADTMLMGAPSSVLDPAMNHLMQQQAAGGGGGFQALQQPHHEQGLFGDVVVGRPQQQPSGSLFHDMASHQQEQALLQHLCQSSAFAQAPHAYNLGVQQQQAAPVVPQAMPVQEHYLGQLTMGSVSSAVSCDLLQQHDRSSGGGSLEMLDGGAFNECAGGNVSGLAMQAQINQLFQTLYL